MDILGPHFGRLISENRTGVVVTLFKKALQKRSCVESLCRLLLESLKDLQPSQDLCTILLCRGSDAELGENFLKLSQKGCMLMETLLHFPQVR